MIYFNYIFISGYRAYLGRNTSPKFTAVSLVVSCTVGLFVFISFYIETLCNNDSFLHFFVKRPYLLLGLFALFFWALYNYYSENRIDNLMLRFDNKSYFERVVWGVVAVISLIVPWILFATMLNRYYNN
jgi:hypothetical protein